MKLVTFNIRCDYDQDKENSFRFRKSLILEKIEAENPDILCFQEVLPHVAVWLKENLFDYYVIGCGRSETLEDEQMTIAYKKDRFNLISMETFWLSPTPYIPASRYEKQSICPRVCTETVFEDLKEKLVFCLFNTHLDHEGAEARRAGISQILKKVEERKVFPDAPVLLVGDFNAEPNSEEIKEIREHSDFVNVTEGIGVTYHGFYKGDATENIDYIYLKNGKGENGVLSPVRVEKWGDRRGEVWLSDHYPVCALFQWV